MDNGVCAYSDEPCLHIKNVSGEGVIKIVGNSHISEEETCEMGNVQIQPLENPPLTGENPQVTKEVSGYGFVFSGTSGIKNISFNVISLEENIISCSSGTIDLEIVKISSIGLEIGFSLIELSGCTANINIDVYNFTSSVNGTAINMILGDLTLSDSSFKNCESSEGVGGAIYLSEFNNNVEFNNVCFVDCNDKEDKGNGIYIWTK